MGEGSRDLANEYSIKNSETVVMTGNDIEMKIKSSYLPEFKVEPPPEFQTAQNKWKPNDERNNNKKK